MNKFSKFPAEVVCELHPLFRGLRWTAAARSTDSSRPAICHLLVEKADLIWTIVATDGRRLHVHEFDAGLFDTDIEGLEPGLYEVVASTAKLIVIAQSDEINATAYPNWRQVVPEFRPTIEDSFDARSIGKMGVRTGVLLATDFAVEAVGFGHGFKNADYIHVTYGSSGEGEVFVIEHELGKAYVMPLRMDEEVKEPAAEEEPEKPKTEAETTPEFNGFQDLLEGLPIDILKNVMEPGDEMEVSVEIAGKKVATEKFTKQPATA